MVLGPSPEGSHRAQVGRTIKEGNRLSLEGELRALPLYRNDLRLCNAHRMILFVEVMHEDGRRISLIAVPTCSLSGISFAGAHVVQERCVSSRVVSGVNIAHTISGVQYPRLNSWIFT